MNRADLAKAIYRSSHLSGEFLLRSGQTSNSYFDKYRFEADPEILQNIAKQMAPLIPQNTDFLAGLELGGVPLATALSIETGLPSLFVRKEAKDYGTCQFLEGYTQKDIQSKRLCIIEDVITTGGQVIKSTEQLRSIGAIVEDVICVIYRGESEGQEEKLKAIKLNHHMLFRMHELKAD